MLAKRSIGKKIVDRVFSTSFRAKEAIKKYGKENVVDSTLGTLFDEDEKLVIYDVVKDLYSTLPLNEFTAYAPFFNGTDSYKEAVKREVLGDNYLEIFPNYYFTAISTPGGTGALYNTIANYLNIGDSLLAPSWMWGPYKLMAEENGGKLVKYNLFTDKNEFDIEDFKKKVLELSSKQDSLVIVINDPCQNPTGFKLSPEEWGKIFDILAEVSKNKKIILIKDIAYFKYDTPTQNEIDTFNNYVKSMNDNFLLVYAFSLSKSLGIYGMRVGAQLALSRNKDIVQEFEDACSASCRALWSNVSRGGMEIFSQVMSNETLRNNLISQRNKYINLLKERSEIFIQEANDVGLKMFPYKSGFFLTIPIGEKIEIVAKNLEKENIFTIIFNDGIRIAICSISKVKLKGLAKKIKTTIENS